ncbi:glycerophosphodiester phosphodiesterase family protein [Gaetbulibacter aestuarii]|uniref:Glycerophosphodiester phosphodiesterase family protein n=1 Tax=Gaetbulibacter aestuarii TaxID=1502358 RepID=A0ABW7MZS7_9FLAO
MFFKKINLLIFSIATILIVYSCEQNTSSENQFSKHTDELIKKLNNPNGKDILVIAHRGDWRNFPENSLEAMESAIKMGVDMVEMDVKKTKDNKLIIMHDATLDRTTTGKGLVSEWTLDSIKKLYLKNGAGNYTRYKIPTLEEALNTCKGKILVNLDGAYDFFDEAFQLAKKTGTTNQIVLKGYNKKAHEVLSDFGKKLDTIIFMPIINLDTDSDPLQTISDYQSQLHVKAFEIVFSKDTSSVLKRFSKIKEHGSRVWVNSLWASLNAGHDDNEAVKNKDSIYGWFVDHGVNMIQTDRPEMLLEYLRDRKLHN